MKKYKPKVGQAMLPAFWSAHLPTALAVGALVLLPALGWQAGGVRSAAVAANVAAGLPDDGAKASANETILGKQFNTWAHTKANRLSDGVVLLQASLTGIPVQPEILVDVITLDASQAPASLTAGTVPGGQDPADLTANQADRAAYDGWLSYDNASGALRITGFETQHIGSGRDACRQQHDEIVRAFAVPVASAKVLADKPVLFQSRICAANGEIVITCHGSTALLSPRRQRPGNRCARS